LEKNLRVGIGQFGFEACSVADYGIKSFKLPVSDTTTSAKMDE